MQFQLAKVCLNLLGKDNDMAMLFPTARIVKEGALYMKKYATDAEVPPSARVHHFELRNKSRTGPCDAKAELHALTFRPEEWKLAKAFWQHAGMGISSRFSTMILESLSRNCELIEVDESSHSLLVSIFISNSMYT